MLRADRSRNRSSNAGRCIAGAVVPLIGARKLLCMQII
jgi:hypothetical protein